MIPNEEKGSGYYLAAKEFLHYKKEQLRNMMVIFIV